MSETPKPPLVTVLVPTIGRMDYLPTVVDAIRAQTFEDYEVLVLDNDAPEPAKSFLEEWAAKEPRVKILRVSPRVPMFQNFARGIDAATGKYTTFMHDDDVYLPTFLATQVETLERNPRAGFCGSAFDVVDENGAIVEPWRFIAKDEVWPGRRYIEELVSRGRNIIPMQGLMFRSKVIQSGGFDTSLSPYYGDFTLLARIAEAWDVALLRDPVMYVRRHGAQASRAFPVVEWAEMRRVSLLAYCDEYVGRHPEERDFVARLRRAVTLRHQVALVWGWVSSEAEADSRACTRRLGDYPLGGAVATMLHGLDRTGARPFLRDLAMGGGVRKLAAKLRI